jgi:hypothetical protein
MRRETRVCRAKVRRYGQVTGKLEIGPLPILPNLRVSIWCIPHRHVQRQRRPVAVEPASSHFRLPRVPKAPGRFQSLLLIGSVGWSWTAIIVSLMTRQALLLTRLTRATVGTLQRPCHTATDPLWLTTPRPRPGSRSGRTGRTLRQTMGRIGVHCNLIRRSRKRLTPTAIGMRFRCPLPSARTAASANC